MYKVHIYVATDSVSSRKSKKKFVYMLECRRKSGKVETIKQIGETEASYHGAVLMGIKEAMERINQSCYLHVHSEDKFVLGQMQNNLERWAANDFRTSKGESVKNQEEWIEIWRLAKGNVVKAEYEERGNLQKLLEEMEEKDV